MNSTATSLATGPPTSVTLLGIWARPASRSLITVAAE
jgi:hypothetical protein